MILIWAACSGLLLLLAGSFGTIGRADDPFPAVFNTESEGHGDPLPPAEAAASFTLPAGFTATVMASEPAVQNPIAMAWDARGRLWVAENFTYAEATQRFDLSLRDRVLIFTDADGDGRFESRSVFTDAVQMLTGIAVGQGGVWLMCPPRLLFIPDRNHDDVPDGPAETILDGFAVTGPSYHNFANGIRFGPDGWLYGRCGHSCPARIGRPGCPDLQRLPMEGGLWRWSPRSHRAEVLTTGTTNPWGHDWNAVGEGFFVNTVNGHLWHLIPGAHFAQANGIDPNPFTYELIDQHADHYHFDVSGGWQNSRDGRANDLGGGHAHSGCMIYGGINWPAEYRDTLFTLNFHGRRVNQEQLCRSGSGYTAHHVPDPFRSGDPWFRGIELASGPDGSVAVLDWSDTGECHERDGVHRTSGRIFRLAFRTPQLPPGIKRGFDLWQWRLPELASLQRHADSWWVTQSQMVLAERALAGASSSEALALLDEQFASADELAATVPGVSASAHRVRAMLAVHAAGAFDSERGLAALEHSDEHVRVWAVRLLTEDWPLDAALGPVPLAPAAAERHRLQTTALLDRLVLLAEQDESALVRLALASTLQRLPVDLRPRLAAALVGRSEDVGDHNLPLLVWYGLIPVAEQNPDGLGDVAAACRWPTTLRLISRRLAGQIENIPEAVDRLLLAATERPEMLGPVLTGLSQGFAGWRKPPRPTAWGQVLLAIDHLPGGPPTPQIQRLATELSALFGDGRALAAVRELALDSGASPEMRRTALATLLEARPPDLKSVCIRILSDRSLGAMAARGLALFDEPEVGRLLVEAIRKARGANREGMLEVVASRTSFVAALLDAVERGKIQPGELSPHLVRQMHALGDASIAGRLTSAWGQLRDSPAEKVQRITELTGLLSADEPGSTSLPKGRQLFQQRCGSCHRLYGEGGSLGPDLTGSGRHDINYLLENMVDPSAVVNRDWRLSILELADGRVLTGVVIDRNEQTVSLQTTQERMVLPASDIDAITVTDRSPMPDGLLDQMSPQQIRDLVAYLRHPTQVPLPE